MDLRTAITRAAKFAHKTHKDFAAIRLIPEARPPNTTGPTVECKGGLIVSLPQRPAQVMASNGEVSILLYLDPGTEVPDCALPAEALRKTIASIQRKDAFRIALASPQLVTITTDSGGSFHMATTQAAVSLPPSPDALWRFRRWPEALQVCHAASEDESQPELTRVHLTANVVEAADGMKVARAPVSIPLQRGVLVPADMFRAWPSAAAQMPVMLGLRDDSLFMFVGEELRWAKVTPDTNYFDLSSSLPFDFHGYQSTVDRTELMRGLKFGTSSSDTDAVQLSFAREELEVCGLNARGDKQSRHVVKAVGVTHPMSLIVRGKALTSALHVLGDVEVGLGYSTPDQPLRIESVAGYVSAVWPLITVST